MLKGILILLFVANLLLIVSSQDVKVTKTQAEARSSASAQSSSSSSSKTDGKSSSSYSQSSATAQASASASSSSETETRKRCKNNERWVECPAALCVPATCDQLGKPIPCPRFSPGLCPKNPSCVCINGYVRNKKGICIPKNECQECGENQRFVECPDAFCVPSDCIQLGRPLLCPIAIPGYCPRKPGCICNEGYVTNGNSTCIPINQCPSCGGDPNAESGCGYQCSSRCDSKTRPIVPCACEFNGCQCKSGFTYDPNQKKCVRPRDCKNLCPKPNEIYDPCPLECPPRVCGVDASTVLCQANQTCQPAGCRCKDGTSRNPDGICVPVNECPKPCPKNEVYTSCANGGCGKWNCTQIDEPILCIDPLECFGGCICKKDYLRSKRGQCIPQEQCRKDLCPKPNEVYDPCPLACPPRVCGVDASTVLCQANQTCQPAGCRCKDGTSRNPDGICVPVNECPKPCPKNEVYTSCANGGCGKWNCTQIDEPILCIDPFECFGGCICKKDFLRSKKGKCIPQEDCRRDLCPKPNETYDPCPLACPPRVCGIDDRAVLCKTNQTCQPAGCRCKDGTYRNKDGVCVLWEDCEEECEYVDGTTTEAPNNTTVTPGSCPDNLEQLLIEANAKLTGLFLYDSVQRKPGESMAMSAFSLMTPIAELAYFSEGDTLKQFLKVLNLPSKDLIRCVFPPLLKALSAQTNVILTLAVRIFASAKYPLTQEFLDYTRDVLDAEAENLDFTNGEAAANRINQWAANATNNLIKQIATPNMFDAATRLVLANAMYFLGNWEHQFNANYTEDRDFYVTKDKIIKVPTMYQQKSFQYGYSSALKCKTLKMDYRGGNFSFVVFLPDDIDGLKPLVEKLQDHKLFYEAYDGLSYQQVQVYMPKFKTESEYNLADIMQKAGMTDVFDPEKSKLVNILKKYEPLFISQAKQKCTLICDEKGTEAAVVNVITVGTTSVQEPPTQFNCDHGFAYYIFYKRFAIFSGVYAQPSPSDKE